MTGDRDALSRYISDIRIYPRITPQREEELSRIVHGCKISREVEEAVDELVVSNLRLVVHCAKDFLHLTAQTDTGLTAMDLVAEGNVALISAAQAYDAQFGNGRETTRFSTYACKCIKRRMLRSIRLSRFIHIPEHHFACRRRIAELAEDHDEALSDCEISNELGITPNKLRMVREGQDSYTFKLEDMSSDDGSSYWMDYIENANAIRPDSEAARKDLKQFIMAEIKKLPPRTRKIILKVFLSQRPFTFRELADEFKVSKERCRQICLQGLKLLRRQIEPRWGSKVGIGLVFTSGSSSRKNGKQKLMLVVSEQDGKEQAVLRGRDTRFAPESVRMEDRAGEFRWPRIDPSDSRGVDVCEDLSPYTASVA